MLICHNCNQRNEDGSPACTTCGSPLDLLHGKATYIDTGGGAPKPNAPPQAPSLWDQRISSSFGANPPKPYAPGPMPAYQPVPQAVPLSVRPPVQPSFGGYRCPFCQSQFPPVRRKRISSGGWVVFAVLLFFCLPFCWLGLLMTEEYSTCSTCGGRLN